MRWPASMARATKSEFSSRIIQIFSSTAAIRVASGATNSVCAPADEISATLSVQSPISATRAVT
jgi:hypothetical protein